MDENTNFYYPCAFCTAADGVPLEF